MKAPEYIKIETGYWLDSKDIKKLKEGDTIHISFGRQRDRKIDYKIVSMQRTSKDSLIGISLERKKELPRV